MLRAENKRVVSRMQKRKRIIAILLAGMISVVMLCSALFITKEADHDCVGENCPICCQINICRNIMKHLSLTVGIVVFAATFIYTPDECISACREVVQSATLVSLKVKLTN